MRGNDRRAQTNLTVRSTLVDGTPECIPRWAGGQQFFPGFFILAWQETSPALVLVQVASYQMDSELDPPPFEAYCRGFLKRDSRQADDGLCIIWPSICRCGYFRQGLPSGSHRNRPSPSTSQNERRRLGEPWLTNRSSSPNIPRAKIARTGIVNTRMSHTGKGPLPITRLPNARIWSMSVFSCRAIRSSAQIGVSLES